MRQMSILTIGVSAVLVAVLMLPKTDGSSQSLAKTSVQPQAEQGHDHVCSNGRMACGGNGLTGSSYPSVVRPTGAAS